MRIGVVATGSELLNGERSDTNTAQIARLLAGAGLKLCRSVTVPDSDAEMERVLADMVDHFDAVVVTGGLGPTVDDVTARVAAKVFRRRLILNEDALDDIRRFFSDRGLPMQPGNEKQALLPQKAQVIINPLGTAPGFRILQGKTDFFFLPGVPEEMVRMLADTVLPALKVRFPAAAPETVRTLKLLGLSEAKADEAVASAGLPEEVAIAYSLDYPFVLLRLSAGGPNAGDLITWAERQVRLKIGDFVVAVDDEAFAEKVAQLLIAREATLALAESCTGGLVSKLLTDIPGSSAFLNRAGVTYADAAKADWLGIDPDLIAKHGAVSEPVAKAMAEGVRVSAGTQIGIGITGIAGPDGGTAAKPVGTVFIALSAPGVMRVKGYRFAGDRERVRLLSAYMALDWIRRYLLARTGE